MVENIIEVKGLNKSFGGVVANNNISLEVKRGKITGLIGPNGSGKTTLFNSIVGFHPIDSGTINFDGKEILLDTFVTGSNIIIEVSIDMFLETPNVLLKFLFLL